VLRAALVAVAVSGAASFAGPAWALEETFAFDILGVTLGEDPSMVVVSAAYTCGPLDFGDGGIQGRVDLTVRQQTEAGQLTGIAYVYPEFCNGLPQTAEATVSSLDGRAFLPGQMVTVLASGYVEGLEGRQTTRAAAELLLQPIPPSFSFTVDADARVFARGSAVTLSGSYTCGPLAFGEEGPGWVDLTVRQEVRGEASGSARAQVTVCDGTPQAWSTTIPAFYGRFRRGPATVEGSGLVCASQPPDGLACQTLERFQQAITLIR
jgi:hypothetical protein